MRSELDLICGGIQEKKLCFSIKLDKQSALLSAEIRCEIPQEACVFFFPV